MRTLKSIKSLNKHLAVLHKRKKVKAGFVPTMGALHSGHLSLIERACRECDYVVCSIYVNPEQFNDNRDFVNYPRDLEGDLKKLEKTGCDVVFAPSVEEISHYPSLPELDLGYLNTVMEGEYRPGHFRGVASIVSKLFNIIRPEQAYFGEKDYQQLLVVKRMVEQHKMNVKINGCTTIRESDGLAMSSRNLLLSESERKSASMIYHALCLAKKAAPEKPVIPVIEEANNLIRSLPHLIPEYFTIADAKSLKIIESWNETTEAIACTAVYAGKIRLIDNIRIPCVKRNSADNK